MVFGQIMQQLILQGGSGIAEDPWQIETAEQLAKLAVDVNSGIVDKTHAKEYFVLTADLDLSAHRWIPIGYGDSNDSFMHLVATLMVIIKQLQVFMWMKLKKE